MISVSENTTLPQPVLHFDVKRAIPWLPSIFVAVLMVFFLAISFAVYHRRRIRQKRAAVAHAMDLDDVIGAGRPDMMRYNVIRPVSGLDNIAFDLMADDEVFCELDEGTSREREREIVVIADDVCVSSYEKKDQILLDTLSSKQENCPSGNIDSTKARIKQFSSEPRQDRYPASEHEGELTATVQIHTFEDAMPLELQHSVQTGEERKSPVKPNHAHVDAVSYSAEVPCLCTVTEHSADGVSGKTASPTKSPNELDVNQNTPLCIVCLVTQAKFRPLGICSSCCKLKDTFLVDVLAGSSSPCFHQPLNRFQSRPNQQSVVNCQLVNEKAFGPTNAAVLAQFNSRGFQTYPCGTVSSSLTETSPEDAGSTQTPVDTRRKPRASERDSNTLSTMHSPGRSEASQADYSFVVSAVDTQGKLQASQNDPSSTISARGTVCRSQARQGETSSTLSAMDTQWQVFQKDTNSTLPTIYTQCRFQTSEGESYSTVSAVDTLYRPQTSQGESAGTMSAMDVQCISQESERESSSTLSAMNTQCKYETHQDNSSTTLTTNDTQCRSRAFHGDSDSKLSAIDTPCRPKASQEDTTGTLCTISTQCRAQAPQVELRDTSPAAGSQFICASQKCETGDHSSAEVHPSEVDVTDITKGEAHLSAINQETCTTCF